MPAVSVSLKLLHLMGRVLLDPEDVEKYGNLTCYVLKNHKHYKYWGVTLEGKKNSTYIEYY